MVACSVTHRTAGRAPRTVAEMVAALLGWYGRATAEQVAEGRVWYSEAGATLRAESVAAGFAEHVGIIVAALLSPRADWAYNLPGAIALLRGETPPAMLLPDRVAIARAYLATAEHCGDSALGDSPKVRPFACNLSGCGDCVTADTWHARACYGTWDVTLRSCGCDHAAIAEATRTAAAMVGETPAAFQAIVWVAIRAANPKGSKVRDLL
jgi:hypothetical protein